MASLLTVLPCKIRQIFNRDNSKFFVSLYSPLRVEMWANNSIYKKMHAGHHNAKPSVF